MFKILLILISIRPFISSLTEPQYAHLVYSLLLLVFLMVWALVKGLSLERIKPVRYPLMLFVFALLVSLIFSYDRINSIKELYKYITCLLLFWVAISLSFKERTLLIRIIVLTSVLISLLAIYQYFFGFKHILEYIAKYNITDSFIIDYVTRKRVFFPFVTPNVLAGYLAMIVPLTFTYKKRIWYIIPLSLALLLTRSLGGLFSLFLGLVIYFFLPRPCAQERDLQKKLEKRAVLLLLGLFIIIILLLIIRSFAPKQHIQPIFSTVMRLNYWKDTLEIIKGAPFTGIGLGNFNLAQSRYAHNSYLQIWAEMGILGIISIFWLIISVFKSTFKNVHLISACSVFLAHNFIDFTFFLPEVAIIWWMIFGLIISKGSE